MADQTAPQTATKTWAPLFVGCSIAAATLLAKPALRLSGADAEALSEAVTTFQALVLPYLTYQFRNYFKQPMQVITPGNQPNVTIHPGTPGWHSWLRWGAILAAMTLIGVAAWRFL